MSKKPLKLQLFEIEQLAENQASISLMPCPCGAAGGGRSRGSSKSTKSSSGRQDKYHEPIAFTDWMEEGQSIQMLGQFFFTKAYIDIFGPDPNGNYSNVKGYELQGGVQNIGGIGTKG